MESLLVTAYHAVGVIGPLGSFALLLILLIERAFDRGWLKFGMNDAAVGERTKLTSMIKQILDNQTSLRSHFNDETTECLKILAEGQKQEIFLIQTQTTMTRDGFRAIEEKFREYDKYGIKANVAN